MIMKISRREIIEERGIFFINFCFVIAMILIFYFQLNLEYFFYFLMGTTFLVSYLTFKEKKSFSKGIILTNLFIFFYFLYPYIAVFTSTILGYQSTYALIFYTLLLAYLFLEFLGKKEEVLESIRSMRIKPFLYILLIGIFLGQLFYFAGEPIPSQFVKYEHPNLIVVIVEIFILSFLIGLSEQLLFTGFVFNTYTSMTREIDAQIQTSLLFIAFHMLRIKALVYAFIIEYGSLAYMYLSIYFIALFIFMMIAIGFYRGMKGHFKGSIGYAILFHTFVDFVLILMVTFTPL